MTNNQTDKPLRAAIYVRVSGDDQKKGYGPAMQLEETKRAATERDGCIVKEDNIIDDSKSGATDDRPGWKKVLELARRGEIDVVYFWKLDRMMRNEYYFYVNEKKLRDRGVQLRFATQNLEDPFNRSIQVAVAAEERRKIRERTYGGRIRALRDSKWVAPIPYGYIIDKKTGRLKINPKEARWVKQLFHWFVSESLSLTALGKRAHAYRIPTHYDLRKKRKSKNGYAFWSKGSLGRMLGRDYYATGIAWFHRYNHKDRKYDKTDLRPKSEWIRVRVPPLISEDLFNKALKQLRRNSEYAWRNTHRVYLFAKKLWCGFCVRKLQAGCKGKVGTIKYYRGERWLDKKCPECRYYRENDLDGPIWEAVVHLFKDPQGFMKELDTYRKGSRMLDVEAERVELSELERGLNRKEKALVDLQVEGFYSKEVLKGKREELQRERSNMEERRMELDKLFLMEEGRLTSIISAERLYDKIRTKLEKPTYELKHRLYGLLIEKIVLHGARGEVRINVPNEIAVPQFVDGLMAGSDGTLRAYGESGAAFIGNGTGSVLLRRASYIERDANEEAYPVIFSVDLRLNQRAKVKGK